MPAKTRPSKVVPQVKVIEKSDAKFIPQVEPKSQPRTGISASKPDSEAVNENLPQSNESALDKRNNKLYLVGIIIGILIICFAVGLFIFSRGLGQTVKPEPLLPMPPAAPSPTPAFDQSRVLIEVLNGSGAPGAAGKAAGKLAALGYSQIITGNTKLVKGTKLFIQNGYKFSANLQVDFESLFGVATVSGELLESTATAQLILGR